MKPTHRYHSTFDTTREMLRKVKNEMNMKSAKNYKLCVCTWKIEKKSKYCDENRITTTTKTRKKDRRSNPIK